MSVKAYDWLAFHAAQTPQKLAVVDLASNREFNYREFNSRAARLASALQADGIALGDRVAVLAPNNTDMLEMQFACSKLGAIWVPLNWRLTVPELEFILNDASPRVLFIDCEFREQGVELKQLVSSLETIYEIQAGDAGSDYEQLILGAEDELIAVERTHDDVMTIMYTSGTTGLPKGAMITHGMTFWNVVNLNNVARVTPDSVHLNVLPLFHTGGLNCYSNMVFHAGGTVVNMRTFDPLAVLNLLQDPSLAISHFFGVPANYQFVTQLPGFATAKLDHLETCGVGGAPCALPILQAWLDKGVPISQGYGMTETSPTVMFLSKHDAARKVGSAGLPALHTAIRVVGEDGADITEPEQMGELWVKGPNITPGYWNRPDATKESITDGWLHTGDAVKFDSDGYYYVVDRWKDMYISGGENVYPAEVENVIYQLPAVAEVAVVGQPDERWGEVGQAVVVLVSDHVCDEQTIIDFCSDRLARFKVPRMVRFIDALPRNATGKVLKRELRGAGYSGG